MENRTQTNVSSGLEVIFDTMLQELYWCERHLCDVLENMQTRAGTDDLKEAFRQHKEETFNQVGRLEKIFSLLGQAPYPKHCTGMQGLFDEGWEVINDTDDGSAHRDAALIIAAQKTEHYEIAAYGSLVTLARTLGYRDTADLLEMTLAEEKQADSILTAIAEDKVNRQADSEMATEITPGAEITPGNESDILLTGQGPAIAGMEPGLLGVDADTWPATDDIPPDGPVKKPRKSPVRKKMN